MIDAAADSSRMPPTIYIRRRGCLEEEGRGREDAIFLRGPSSRSRTVPLDRSFLPAASRGTTARMAEARQYDSARPRECRHFHNIQMHNIKARDRSSRRAAIER